MRVATGTTEGVVIGVVYHVDTLQLVGVWLSMIKPALFIQRFWATELVIVRKGVR